MSKSTVKPSSDAFNQETIRRLKRLGLGLVPTSGVHNAILAQMGVTSGFVDDSDYHEYWNRLLGID